MTTNWKPFARPLTVLQLLYIFLQFSYYTSKSQQIDSNIGSNTIICSDPISCILKCDNNGCNNGNYHCINTPICNIECDGTQHIQNLPVCNNLDINIKSDTTTTKTTIQCIGNDNNECDNINININSDIEPSHPSAAFLQCIHASCNNIHFQCDPSTDCHTNCDQFCQESTLKYIKKRTTLTQQQQTWTKRRLPASNSKGKGNKYKVIGCGDKKSSTLSEPVTVSAKWSSSFLSILVSLIADDMVICKDDLTDDCSQILDVHDLTAIGTKSECIWTQNENGELELIIDLSSEATIDLDDTLTIWNKYVAESIDIPLVKSKPNIVITSKTNTIGICDDLVLDARSSTNLGGREGIFEWIITNIDNSTDTIRYNTDYVVIDSELLQSPATYKIALSVTNWYGETSNVEYNVFKSNEVIPVISLHGISDYNPSNTNLNGKIQIYSDINFQSECINTKTQSNADDIINVLQYDIEWSVNIKKINENDNAAVDHPKIVLLQDRLSEAENMESVIFDGDSLLQSGFIYEFIMNLQCVGQHECNIDTTHDVVYDHSDIECDIMGGDIIELNNVDPAKLSDINIELNGLAFTYDPDGSDALQWNWDCMQIKDGESCADLLDNDEGSIVNIDLSALSMNYSSSYSYLIRMGVSDNDNTFRDSCSDSITLNINTADINNIDSGIQSLIISATAITTKINRNDTLRVLADIADGAETDGFIFEYKWKELNDLLSDDELAEYQQLNLILESDMLSEGETYVFQLIVTQKSSDDGSIIGYGESNPVSIYMNRSPIIRSGSFQIHPLCTKQYESISELLSETHSVSIVADADNAPLLYQFGYKHHYFHETLLSESSISGLYLPAMDDFIIFANVYDSESSVVSAEIQCSITLNSYSKCIDFEEQIDKDFPTQSAKNAYILQQSQIYLQYLTKYNGDNEHCIQQQLVKILDIIYQQFVVSNDAICDPFKSIQLTQTMISLLSLINADTALIRTFYEDQETFNKIEELLFVALDPCSYITDTVKSIKALSVSDDSVITQIPKIYYNDNDISQYLSPIISQPGSQDLLFSMAPLIITIIKSVSYENSMEIYKLLSSSIYIAQLVDLSVSISGESKFAKFDSFSVYSTRISNKNIDVVVQSINVHIPNEVTVISDGKNNDNSPFEAVDVLITGIDISATDNIAVNIDNNDFDATISDKSISITLLSDSVDPSDLPSNIEITFECDDKNGCDELVKCVWYNEEKDIWKNDGCDTIIDDTLNTITCSCSHLTTFAVIYNMHQPETDGSIFVDSNSSEEWKHIHWILTALFLMIAFYVIFEIYPFFSNKELDWKHRPVFVMLLVGITSFLHFLISLEYFIPSISIKLMSLLLLLPHISYLLIFSVIFYTWFTLAHSFHIDIEEIRNKLQRYLIALNIGIILLLIIYYILILCDVNHITFRIASFAWSGFTAIITIIITIYAIISGKVLYETTKKTTVKQSFAANDWKVVRRLIIINSFITLYFIFETFVTIYYAIYIDNTSDIISHKLLELIINAFCLICICWMYRSSMRRLIQSGNLIAKQNKMEYLRRKTMSSATNNKYNNNNNKTVPRTTSQSTVIPIESTTKSPKITPKITPKISPRISTVSRISININNLDVIEEEKDIIAGMDKIYNKTPSTFPNLESNDNINCINDSNRNSTVIAADIRMPEISTKSISESNLIDNGNDKKKDIKNFQFYYNLRGTFNAMRKGKNNKNNKNDDNVIKEEREKKEEEKKSESVDLGATEMSQIEDAMYMYSQSKSIK